MSIPALQVTDLTKTWPAFCLDQVSFTVPQGTCTALIGENGSGKSTILRCLLGMDVFSGGSVSVFGENPLDNPAVHVLMGIVQTGCCFRRSSHRPRSASYFPGCILSGTATNLKTFSQHRAFPCTRS